MRATRENRVRTLLFGFDFTYWRKKQCETFQPNITMGKTTKTTTTKLLRAIGQATFCSLWGCHFRHNFLRYIVTILKQIVRHSDVFKMALIL